MSTTHPTAENATMALPPSTTSSLKARTIAYWICTALISLSFLGGGAADLTHAPQVMQGLTTLGYPAHFATLLGLWKILGVIAVLAPGVPRLKEWAYAGMIFDLTGASFTHAVVGDSDASMGNVAHIIVPLVIASFVVASWALRPESRKLKQA